ncbi:hypothetical protein LR48_Vigan07g048300 [Vigna angularis]|uniref:Transmembrane protein 256 homolog n=3 Tax=Vigna TaxID=3913 RepID=A0A0L9UW54_PHAAN|nr:uncharacterized protein LOC108337361 isoform X1 [Vigna angularis]KOM46779.1 hypothetical protein LR48_Vigan07g048300 [Vigna angularis]BAT80998.1 hypothetical protein VIGAN_03063400 [Vigna angularis var. angularis]
MDPQVWHKVAAISGVAALGLGTYGAHVFKPQNPAYKEVWHTASLYHLVHTAALVAAPITKHPTVFGGLLTTGILAFSGTCYTVALLEDRKHSTLAPFGGFAFIAAWVVRDLEISVSTDDVLKGFLLTVELDSMSLAEGGKSKTLYNIVF